MKKIFSLLLILTLAFSANSQVFVRVASGRAAYDTLIASKTIYTQTVNVGALVSQSLGFTFAVDSISGAPAGSFIVQRSVDGVHFNALKGDTVTYTNSGWSHNGVGSGETLTNQSFFLNYYPFYGNYVRVVVKSTSATQRIRYWITVRSNNYK